MLYPVLPPYELYHETDWKGCISEMEVALQLPERPEAQRGEPDPPATEAEKQGQER